MQGSVNKQHGKGFSWPLYGFSIVLVSLFIGIFIKTFFSSTNNLSEKKPKQCPDNFRYYQNKAYSICYPQKWVVREEKDITYADGSISQNIVSFTNPTNSLEHINVIPNRGILPPNNSPCLLQQNTSINSYSVLRLIFQDISKKGECGKIVSYISVFQITQTTGQYKKGTVISYVTGEGVSLSPEEYASMENSLKILHN